MRARAAARNAARAADAQKDAAKNAPIRNVAKAAWHDQGKRNRWDVG